MLSPIFITHNIAMFITQDKTEQENEAENLCLMQERDVETGEGSKRVPK